MKSLLLIFTLTACSNLAFVQTILHQENFESGTGFTLNTTDVGGTTGGDNPWVINNVYAGGLGTFTCFIPFPFTVPSCATQPAGITNSPTSYYLHVTPQIAIAGGGTLPAASYVVANGFCIFGGQSNFAKMNTDISTIGQDSVTLDLWWMCGGSTLYYGEVYYSTNGGVSWTILNNPENGTSKWIGQETWVASEVTNASWSNQATLRFGFRFITGTTDSGSDLDPGFAIDDITITGYTTSSCTPTASTINITACNSYVSPSGLYTWTSSNIYNDTIPNAGGCDSVITVSLTINTVDASASQSGLTLSANNAGATYQWLDCDNGYSAIGGATAQEYIVTTNGDYAVKVTDNGCTDTSSCFTVFDLGLENKTLQSLIVYPNPATDFVTITSSESMTGTILVKDIAGREIYRTNLNSATTVIPLSLVSDGIYFITLLNESGNVMAVEKLVKK